MTILAIEQLAAELSKLPTIGQRSARRLAYYLVANRNLIDPLIKALLNSQKINFCEQCFAWSEQTICNFCLDPKRNKHQICVLEEPAHVFTIEESGAYKGLYHVLGGVISPIKGKSPESLNLDSLAKRINEQTTEIILATNPTVEGQATAHYIRNYLPKLEIKITRLATGMATGSEIEYSDSYTLQQAFDRRVLFD